MKRMLMLASVASMIDQFNMPNIELLQEMGYAVDVACNFKEGNTCSDKKISELRKRLDRMNVRCYQIDFARDVTVLAKNIKALWQVEYLLKNNEYDFLHCHSPIGGVVGRIAGKLTGTKVIYTAHGFHFYKGAPLKNWLVYYPIEKVCAHCTDTLITINHEDYDLAQKKLKAKKVEYTPGVGISEEQFGNGKANKEAKRKELGIPAEAPVFLSVGELNDNKNHKTVIKAISKMDIFYLIAGQGEKREELQDLIDSQGMTDRIKLLGFRSDIKDLYEISDYFVFPSIREGLSVSLMEAMASGLPCAVSRIRGNVDLIDKNGGTFFEPEDIQECHKAVLELMKSDRAAMGEYNICKIHGFSSKVVTGKVKKIYESI